MKKNKITEARTIVNKQLYGDPQVQQTAKKNHDELFLVPDDVYKKMIKSGSAMYGGNADVSDVSTTTTSTSVYEEDGMGEPVQVDAVIEPQDAETIKYLSNVKDDKTGDVSKPFVIADKRYQMVRGVKPNREVVLAVFCHDDMGVDGSNLIQSIEEFEKKVAGPMLEMEKGTGDPYSQGVDYSDIEGYRHFFVDKADGSLKGKFKTIKDMMMSGIPLGENEQYLNLRELKKNRINRFMESNSSLNETDIPKLKTDVQKLVDLIKAKFSTAFAKLDKPIEQVQFLDTLGQEFGLTKDKIAKLTSSLKAGVDPDTTGTEENPEAGELGANPIPVAERKIITKQQFSESIKKQIK